MKRQDLPWPHQSNRRHGDGIPDHETEQVAAERLPLPEAATASHQHGHVRTEPGRIKARYDEQNRIKGRGEVSDFESLRI